MTLKKKSGPFENWLTCNPILFNGEGVNLLPTPVNIICGNCHISRCGFPLLFSLKSFETFETRSRKLDNRVRRHVTFCNYMSAKNVAKKKKIIIFQKFRWEPDVTDNVMWHSNLSEWKWQETNTIWAQAKKQVKLIREAIRSCTKHWPYLFKLGLVSLCF